MSIGLYTVYSFSLFAIYNGILKVRGKRILAQTVIFFSKNVLNFFSFFLGDVFFLKGEKGDEYSTNYKPTFI